MSAYALVLAAHSWLRWMAIVAGFGATMAALKADASAGPRAERWGLFLMMALDLQMLLGLMLYLVFSPFTTEAMNNFSEAVRQPPIRYWAVEHAGAMMLAVILAHAGRVLARLAKTPESRRLRLLVCFGAATFLMMLGTPWPGLANGRPLFRL